MPPRLPNLRTLIIPDPGHLLIDMDLDRADLQVVAWECMDEALLAKLEEERRNPDNDIHSQNARSLFGSVDAAKRRFAKVFCHGTDYLATARTIAAQLGITIREAETAQARWFGIHPGIQIWHKRIESELKARRYVANKFGYRRFFMDRIENCLTDAVAWVPASTVALVTHHAMCNIGESGLPVQILMNGHDSLLMQVPVDQAETLVPEIERLSLIPIPYDPVRTIPVGFSTSERSWGEVEPWIGPRYAERSEAPRPSNPSPSDDHFGQPHYGHDREL